MIGRLFARLLGLGEYTEEHHAGTLEAIAETGDRLVGTCGTCGADLWLLLDPKRVVCGCGVAIPPAFFAYAEGRARP